MLWRVGNLCWLLGWRKAPRGNDHRIDVAQGLSPFPGEPQTTNCNNAYKDKNGAKNEPAS